MKGFDDFRSFCIRNGDEPQAIDDFITFISINMDIWRAFWMCAVDEANEKQPNVMRCMAKMRERFGIKAPNSISPGLARMVNCKAGRKIFNTGKMVSFSEKFGSREAA